MGVSPDSGHYVAVIKHGQEDSDWWLYDDQSREPARDEQARTMQTEYQFIFGEYAIIHVTLRSARRQLIADTNTCGSQEVQPMVTPS